MNSEEEPRIYLLPNLMTAGNLFCGFAAVLRLIEAAIAMHAGQPVVEFYHQALLLILGACVFDILDGRLARLGGSDSPFGREFDSLADVVSFGITPSLLMYQIVLRDVRSGWLIAFVFLLCGTLRLARFNCYAAAKTSKAPDTEFVGFPIPAAAGLIASLTLFMLWLDESNKNIGYWKYVLAALMLFLSFMMFSRVRYPSFKGLGWHTKRSLPRFLGIIVVLAFSAANYQWMPALLFVAFLVYGFVRPFISMAMRHEIEDEDDEDSAPNAK